MQDSLLYWANLYEKLKSESLCLDIELTGMRGEITLIGIYKPRNGLIDADCFIKGQNLTIENLKNAFEGCKMLITYNGLKHDIPIIRKEFPGAIPDKIPVIDLYIFATNLFAKYTNLKVLENTLGIERLDSRTKRRYIAAKLWRRYMENNDAQALTTLIEYNKQDTINLYPIAEEFVKIVKTRNSK